MTSPRTTTQPRRLRRAFRIAALVVLVTGTGFWATKGAHTGWSMNQVPVKQTDEITGIEFVTYEKRFVPGVDFLGAGVGLAAGLFALSFLVQRKTINPSS